MDVAVGIAVAGLAIFTVALSFQTAFKLFRDGKRV